MIADRARTDATEETRSGSFDYAIALNRWSMRLLGLWPLDDSRLANLRYGANLLMTIVFVIPATFRLATLTDSEAMIDQASMTVPYLLLPLKYALMKMKAKNFRAILQAMAVDWASYRYLSRRNRRSMIRYAKAGRRINIMCMILMTLAIIVYLLTPFLRTWRNNLPWNVTTKRLPTDGLYPFPSKQPPVFELLYVAQTIVACISGMVIFSVDCFLCNVVYHACGQLDVLAATLKRNRNKFAHDYAADERSRTCACLSCIVRRHVYIISYMDTVERSFNSFICLQLWGNIFIVTLMGTAIVTYARDSNIGDLITFVIYETMFTYGIFIYCHVGECIIEKSEDIGRIAYNLDWNYFPRNYALSIILLIIRSRKPCKITAGRFVTMCLSYYKTILMTSISYVSVLKAVK